MTWRQFKEKVEKLGVKDSDELAWIDWQDDEPVLFSEAGEPVEITS